ncbi:MOSC domain-containing protein [Salinarchaeum chitinilyticum]
MAHVERIDAYPVKGLDRCPLDRARVLEGGTLEHDREYALYDADGDVINGKRTALVHEVDATYDPESGTLTVDGSDGGTEPPTFDLPDETARAASHLGAHFDVDCTLERNASRGFVDRPEMGPSIVSTATLETIASWYDAVTLDGARRRFRANVEVGGVPAFWEDRFVGAGAPAFRIGDVRFEGVTPCGRCVVPSRDPDTGEAIEGFQSRFVERREATFPEWADRDAFDHYFTVMLIAAVDEADRGRSIAVGDEIEILDVDE